MFDRLIDIAAGVWDQAVPFVTIDCDFRAVRLRFGKYVEDLEPGVHWKIPFADSIRDDQVTPRVLNLDAQSLVTFDKQAIMISTIATIEISDIRKALTTVQDVDEAIEDCCVGAIGDAIRVNDWETITGPEFPDHLRKQCQRSATRFGIKIVRLQINDLALTRTYRVVQ